MECWVKAAQGGKQDPTEQLQLGSANCHVPKNMPPLPSLHLLNLLLLPALAGQQARCVGPRGAERSRPARSVHLVQAGRESARNKSQQSSGCLQCVSVCLCLLKPSDHPLFLQFFIRYHLPSVLTHTHIPSQSKCCPRGRLVFSFHQGSYALNVNLNAHVHLRTHARRERLKMDVTNVRVRR